MGYQQSFAISAAGMDLERLRVEVATLNLANANTVLAGDGSGYQPLRVVAHAGVDSKAAAANFQLQFAQGLAAPTATVEASGTPARQVIDPGHPMADSRGFVKYPGVDTTTEMMTLMTALRAYEANVAAMNSSRTMALKALDIGGGQ